MYVYIIVYIIRIRNEEMDSELTLKLNKNVIDRAKTYSNKRRNGIQVSGTLRRVASPALGFPFCILHEIILQPAISGTW